MLIWGSKGELVDLGAQGIRKCPTCEQDRPFTRVLQYRVHHIWFLFKWVTQKQYLLACDVCHKGTILDAETVESSLGEHPIPWMSRYGWTALVGLLAFVFSSSAVSDHRRASRIDVLFSAPQAHDLYVVNLASLMKDPEGSRMYGVMRVRSAQSDGLEFDMPMISYSGTGGATKDIEGGKLSSSGYFTPEPLTIPMSVLATLKKDGAIHSIERD